MADEESYHGLVAYVFESGHEHQEKANRIMHILASDDDWRKAQRYASHAFVDKRHNRPIQAPDVLAWHVTQLYRRTKTGRPKRKDYEALIRDQDQKYISLRGNKGMFEGVAIDGWKWFRSNYLGRLS